MFDKKDINAVIFDYGGTLDSNGKHWARVIWEGYKASEIDKFISEDTFRKAYVHGERTLAKNYIIEPSDNFLVLMQKKAAIQMNYLYDEGLIHMSNEECKTASNAIASFCYDYARLHIDMARDLLVKLKEKYRLVLVSNFYGNIQTILRDFNICMFDGIIESAVVGVRKPAPAIYRIGVEAAKTAPCATVVVGDSYDKDIVPAGIVGCHTIWIKGQGWTDNEETPEGADYTIHELSDVLKYL